MNSEELRTQSRTGAPHMKIAAALWIVGMMIVMGAAVTAIVLAVMAGDYFANSKGVRDAAEAGSGILSQQGSIEAVRAWLPPFAFMGIATFILGFGFAFANILRNIRLRGGAMAAVLPELKQRKGGG